MSNVLNTRLVKDDLKALPAQFRVVKTVGPADAVEHFLVGDFPERLDALERWRTLLDEEQRGTGDYLRYTIYDDHGRKVDEVGIRITEEDRVAPPGKFRVICADIRTGTIWLVADMNDRGEAINYAKEAYEGPYTGFQVHNDIGEALIPVN